MRRFITIESNHEHIIQTSLVKDLAEDFDTLTAFSKEAKGNPSGLSHFKHIGKNSELISKSQRELRPNLVTRGKQKVQRTIGALQY